MRALPTRRLADVPGSVTVPSMPPLARVLPLVLVGLAALATPGDRAPAVGTGQPCHWAIDHAAPPAVAADNGCAHSADAARLAPSLCAALCLGSAVLASVTPALPPLVDGRCTAQHQRSVKLLQRHPDPRPPQLA